MRVDDAGPRTWILAAMAGWGLLAWVLALFGMGGHIAPLADDPSMLKPLPSLPVTHASRLGPIGQYREFATRPLFAVDRRPKPFSLKGDDSAADAQAFDYVLTSVMLTPDLKLAILQPPDGSTSVRVKLGEAPESHPEWRLSVLDARRAVFDGPGEQRTLDLRVFDGTGGQPPTAIARDNQAGGPITLPDAYAGGVPAPTTVKPATPSAPMPPVATNTSPVPTAAKPKSAATPATPPATTPAQTSPMTEQTQMEAIRQRIQARRAAMRQSPPKPAPSP